MKQIILLRHTEKSISNNGDTDVDLTEKGITQANEIKKFLEGWKYNVIYTSLYLRSIKTADIINIGMPLVKANAFNEYYVRKDGTNLETTEAGITRTMTKIYSLFETYDYILISAHKNINRTIVQCVLNIDYDEAQQLYENNGELHILRYDWTLEDKRWNIITSFIPKQ